MNNEISVNHNYPLYILIWLIIAVFIPWFFKFMYYKIKNTREDATRNSLFTITIFIGVPLLISLIIGPLIFIIGDYDMKDFYRYLWIGLMVVYASYFINRQTSDNKSKLK